MSRRSTYLIVGSVLLTGACAGNGAATLNETGDAGGVADSGAYAGSGGTGLPFLDTGLAPPVSEEQRTRRLDVSVEQGVNGRGTPFSRVTVSMSGDAFGDFPDVQVIDNCEVTDLRDFGGYPAWTPNAGVITIEQEDTRDIVMMPLQLLGFQRVPYLYSFQARAEDVPLWEPGDELFIYALGDDVPSFRSLLEFPRGVEVRKVVHRGAQNRLPTIYRDRALRLFWSPIEEPVGVSILQYRLDEPERLAYCVRCAFMGDQGFGRIPARALEGLDQDDALEDDTSRTEAYVNGLRVARMQRDNFDVVITFNIGTGFMLNVQ